MPVVGTVRVVSMAQPTDTTAEAWSRQFQGFRAMRPQDRLRLAVTMTEEVLEIARAGIRRRHPQWTDVQIQEELEELLFGTELARTARRERLVVTR